MKMAHRWSPIISRLTAKGREANRLKALVEDGVPERGIATCIKENPNGFSVGGRYVFRRETGYSYCGPYNRIIVDGDRCQYGSMNWVFIDNDADFHTYFSIMP